MVPLTNEPVGRGEVETGVELQVWGREGGAEQKVDK